MTHDPTALPAPARPGGGDTVATVVLLVLAAAIWALGSLLMFFMLAFLDYCPEETCSVDGATTSVLSGIGIATAVGVVGLVATIVQKARGRHGWPFALGTLLLVPATLAVAVVFFADAVG